MYIAWELNYKFPERMVAKPYTLSFEQQQPVSRHVTCNTYDYTLQQFTCHIHIRILHYYSLMIIRLKLRRRFHFPSLNVRANFSRIVLAIFSSQIFSIRISNDYLLCFIIVYYRCTQSRSNGANQAIVEISGNQP